MRFLILCFFLISTSLFGQKKISGIIEDSQTGKPLNKVEVGIVGHDKVKKTNKKGKFKLKVYHETDTVYFKKEGYYTEFMQVNNAKKVKVGLTKIAKEEKVIEDSYGSQDVRSSTSSISILEEEDFNKAINIDIYQYLRGKVPGLTIRRDAQNPNVEPVIMLRNASSINGNNKPLIIVDGVQNVSLSTVDPNDVKSVTVLRDGSAQAMYGSQANAGVIVIKTKKK